MKKQFLATIALLACGGAAWVSATPKAPSKLTGDYVEARTASVYAGACHYNGELVTVGKDAVMSWNFAGGSYNGVDMTGVRAVAAVTSDANLIEEHAARRSELAVDPGASDKQVAALKDLLEQKFGTQLGKVVAVRRTPVSFSHTSNGYVVNAPGFASMNVQYMPDDSCCKTPSLVWYSPISPLENRKVGFTESASFNGSIADQWTRSGENSAFYGSFSY